MLWLFFSLAAAFVLSLSNIIDKHIISDEMRDPAVATTVAGFTLFLFFSLFSLFSSPLALPINIILLAFFSGIFYMTALYFYYRTSQGEEISRVIPIIKLDALLVMLFFLFLGESLSPTRYLGIFLLIGGAIMLSFKRHKKKLKLLSVIWLAILTTTFFAFRSITLEFATFGYSLPQVLSWVGLGGLLTGAVFLAIHHPKIKKKSRKGIKHLLATNFLAIIFLLFFTLAISLESASLVVAATSTQVLMVFLIAIVMSKTHSHFLKEELRHSTLLLKGLAITITFLGLLLIV